MNKLSANSESNSEECVNPLTMEDSQIKKFYAGKSILLTGCTGFVGKAIVEKLLRTCTEINKIYTVIRPKKTTIHARMDKYFEDIIFDKLREENPNFRKHIVPIQGDLLESDLGISPEDRQILIENVNIVIHNAASVYFTEKLSVSLKVNALATKKCLDLAAECHNIKAFMYISTAYSHCYKTRIEEKFYPPPGDLNVINDIIRAESENETGISEESQRMLLGQWSNIYTYSKSMAEGIVEEFGKTSSFPCGVFRPSIVTGTLKEPFPAWWGNRNGPVMLYIGMFLGLIHVMYMPHNPIMDCVPADMTTNAILATIWDLASYRKPKEPAVYNYGSSFLNPLKLYNLYENCPGVSDPSIKAVWIYFVILAKTKFTFWIFHFFFHFIPAAIVDLILLLRGKKALALEIFWKFTTHMDSVMQFTNGDWVIETNAIQGILTRMNPTDRKEFFYDFHLINWYEYVWACWTGIRLYILKESAEILPAARRKYRKLQILHYTTTTLLLLLMVYWVHRLATCLYG